MALVLALVTVPHDAKAQPSAGIEAMEGDGFGRIILSFPKPTKIDVKVTTGVLVLGFPEPVRVNARKLTTQLPGYIGAARADPDGMGLRLALVTPYEVNVMEAAEKVVVDLLPADWRGLPPGLPQEIIAELEARANDTKEVREKRERAERIATARPIVLRAARLPTFTRIVFDWEAPPTASIERRGGQVTVTFDAAAKVNLGAVRATMPEWIEAIEHDFSEAGGLRISLAVDTLVNVRGFPEGNTYVIDVTNPEWAGDGNSLALGSEEAGKTGELEAISESSDDVVVPPGSPAGDGVAVATEGLDPQQAPPDSSEPEVPAGAQDDAAAPAAREGAAPEDIEALLADHAVSTPTPEEVQGAPADASPQVAEKPGPEVEPKPVSAFDEVLRVSPKVRINGGTVKVEFPFVEPTAASVFERHGTVWFVFDTPIPIDARVLRNDLKDLIYDLDHRRSGQRQVIRLLMRDPALISASLDNTSWLVTLGDIVLSPPKPLAAERVVDGNGEGFVEIPFATFSSVHELDDPITQSRFMTVTGFGPARAVFKSLEHVDFRIDPSVHGVVVQPLVDDLEVRAEDGKVRIARPQGLVLSGEGARVMEVESEPMVEEERPAFVSIETDAITDEGGVSALVSRTQQAIAGLPEEERTAARLRLARLFLAADLAPEGLGMLRYAETQDPAINREPSFRAMYGVAKVLMARSRDAIRTFETFRLGENSDIALWRTLAHVDLGDWRKASRDFLQGEAAIGGYSVRRQIQFRLAGARAALEVGDLKTASRQIGVVQALTGSHDANPELLLLWGWLSERMGRSEQALGAYEHVAKSRDRKLNAEATLRLVMLKHTNEMTLQADAIEELERLAIVWRGGTIELKTLRHLARLQAAQGNHRRAFEVMKAAIISDSESPITRAIETEMREIFADLFIDGKANDLPAVEALALYYDFREMTPVGRRGDEMIRALADRLIEIDLLDQAAQLLSHQVDNRLNGAARAQIAAKLALVHLMNRSPEKALGVLSRTRQAVLPRDVMNQRIVLEARALSETGRADLAVELLSTVEDIDVASLKADALWQSENWQEAAEQLERLLADTWKDDMPPDEMVRFDIMRTAISYSLAGDNLGLGRIRQKFAEAMADTPDAVAFEVVTGGVPDSTGDFREVVRAVAATDTLSAFLDEYKARFDSIASAPSKEETSS